MQVAPRLALYAFGAVGEGVSGCGGGEGVVLNGRLAGVGGVGDGEDVPVGAEVFAEDGVVRLADFAALWPSMCEYIRDFQGSGIERGEERNVLCV